MELNVERQGDTLIANAAGRIDGVNASDFEQSLSGAIDDSDTAVVVDLAGLSYISSAGLRAVLLTAKSLSRRSAKFALCSPSKPIREVFEISGFDKIIDIHDTREAAVSAVG